MGRSTEITPVIVPPPPPPPPPRVPSGGPGATGTNEEAQAGTGAPPAPPEATGDGRVKVAYLHGHRVSHSWHDSMMRLLVYDMMNEARILDAGGPFSVRCDSGGLPEGRNLAVGMFLDETPHEWLFFVDTDMGFEPDILERLLHAASPAQRPVVGALCFSLREISPDGKGGFKVTPAPTMFNVARTPDGHVGYGVRWDVPQNTLVQVAGTGAAALLIHRTALEKVRAQFGDRWFDQVRYENGTLLSEDLSFCYRLGMCKQSVFVHTGIQTTHHKDIWVSADDYTPPSQSAVPAGVKVHRGKRGGKRG